MPDIPLRKLFDRKCLELALDFLEDDPAFFMHKSDSDRERIARELAADIQQVIEDGLSEMHRRTYGED